MGTSSNELCKICGCISLPFGSASLIEKYEILYYQCSTCGFVQTESPYWLDEVYTEAINDSDIGLVGRNLTQLQITHALLALFFQGDGTFVDYGGGYGLFVRLMRDKGFDFYRYDTYCENLFAKGFDAAMPPVASYELLTAFEVFEHLVDPLPEIEKMLHFSRTVFFSTELLPQTNPKPGEWWYYGLEHGQHVSLYTRRSLEIVADKLGLTYYTNGTSLHLLTEKKLNSRLFSFISHYKVAVIVNLFHKRASLLAMDYEKITGHGLV